MQCACHKSCILKNLRAAERNKMDIDHERFAYWDTSDIVQSNYGGSNLVKGVKEAHDIHN